MATDDARALVARAPANYSASAEGYAEFWSPVIRPLGRRLLEALPWVKTSRALDRTSGPAIHSTRIIVPPVRCSDGVCVRQAGCQWL
jgi:hypothetical protein